MAEVTLKHMPTPGERLQDSRSTGMAPLKLGGQSPAPSEPAVNPSSETKAEPSAEGKVNASPELVRYEKALRQQARELQTLKKQLAEQTKPQPVSNTPAFSKEQFLKDPTALGVTYEEIAQIILNQPTPESQGLRTVQSEIDAIKKAQEEQQKQAQEAQKIARANAIKQISREVNTLVSNDEAFSTIKELGRQDAVTALIELTYDEEGIVMPTEEAAREVEEHLVAEATRMATLKKIKDKLNPTEQQSSQQQQTKPPTVSTTLTRSAIDTSTKSLTSKERVQRAKLAFQGLLK